jgi:hypothetical protein
VQAPTLYWHVKKQEGPVWTRWPTSSPPTCRDASPPRRRARVRRVGHPVRRPARRSGPCRTDRRGLFVGTARRRPVSRWCTT